MTSRPVAIRTAASQRDALERDYKVVEDEAKRVIGAYDYGSSKKQR